MGDENTVAKKRQVPPRNKVIIRKCKKSSSAPVPKSTEDSKKVNGELSAENKGKEGNDFVKADVLKPKEPASKSTKGAKRKLSETVQLTDVEEDSVRSDEKKDNGSDGNHDSPVQFKGFKKRILARTEKLNTAQGKSDSDIDLTQELTKKNLRPRIIKVIKSKKKVAASGKKAVEGDSDENQAESQTEYAQYLGLQPTMQFKCYRCGEKGFPSMLALNMHQRGCGITQKSNFIANLQQDTSIPPSDPNMLTNFRITRKVYLCSACGTYYENWNLFLHMRDVHKKHICLYCLTMFGLAEKLADHLRTTHNIQESNYKSSEEFQNAYKGSCYLICCACENMFNERDDYFYHQCVRKDPTAKCNLCGVKCGHYYTCPNRNTTRNVPVSVNISQPTSVVKSQSTTLTKYNMSSKNKTNEELWMGKKGHCVTSSDNDEDYDISHAASFCHVDIGDESGEKDKNITEDNPVDISDSNETSKTDESVNEKSNCTELTAQGEEESVLNKAESVIEDEPEKSKNTAEPEFVIPQECPEERKNEDNEILKEDNCEKNVLEEGENVGENNTIEKESSNNNVINDEENLVEDDSQKISRDDEVEKNVHIEDENSKDPQNTTNLCEDTRTDKSPQEAVTIIDKTENDEVTKVSDEESLPRQNEKDDSASSDTDVEPSTHLSISQESSESSSDESSYGEPKQSIESNKDDSACESEDSHKSGLVVDEKPRNLDNDIFEDNKTQSDGNISVERDSSKEVNISLSTEASKDFHLDDDVSPIEKPVENSGKENGSTDMVAEELCESPLEEVNDGIPLASEDVPAMALTLEDKLENVTSQSVIKECVRTSCLNCVYCSHAIKIAVNGKQLALHLLAEHRYKPIKNNETSLDVIKKLKNSLTDLEVLFFNTDSYDSSDKSLNTSYDYTYECFQCRFITKIHKELYIHKRKMHQKTVSLCVMCKSNFYSYSELLCHMCPGIYVSEDVKFRCCFCNMDMIPSAFRLLVHLRKTHHTCDICLEVAGDQQKLSTHMWKHKLNHLCYRCGIAYRNKPDITKHLFWKHGTESVLCKKCLQKKWPHVYHFCIPPTVFICEECNASFTKAVALKVHKRLHSGELPHGCSKCDQKFVSTKLLVKHEDTHNQPPPVKFTATKSETESKHNESTDEHINVESIDETGIESTGKDKSLKNNDAKPDTTPDSKSKKKKKKDKDKKGKPVVDVYDLPPLNLSSESDSSDEELRPLSSETSKEKQAPEVSVAPEATDINSEIHSTSENIELSEENQTPAPVVDGVWDNFHSYKAELEKRESKDLSLPNILPSTSAEPKIQPEILPEEENVPNWVLMDHCYCIIPGKSKQTENEEEEHPSISEPAPVEETPMEVPEEIPAPRGHSSSIDHAYATLNNTAEVMNTTVVSPEQPPIVEQPPLTPPQPPIASLTESHTSSKKKPKTPKKKKHNTNSSSSSDSSSDTDSSSCTCKTNCSCSCTSNSSSSSSSDSDSSTSEGKRRVAARREKKKERLKHKHHKEEPAPVPEEPPAPPPPPPEEEAAVDIPVEPVELPIRESDLDTNESSTDEDFYDKYPQSHAKQQMEKRNKLMLLASVAPVNNGTVSPTPPPPVETPTPPPAVKRKIKTKKRRKSQQSKKYTNKTMLSHQQTQPSTSLSLSAVTATPSLMSTNHHNLTAKIDSPLRTNVPSLHSDATAGSGSENESARLSKRKRVRNKFYGYSSEEEEHDKPGSLKWRKTDILPLSQPSIPSGLSPQSSLTVQRPQVTIAHVKRPKPSESSESDEEPPKKEDSSNSSSSSSDSENEIDTKANIQKEQTEKSDNLYCYCQCPYDEVSEMIACDGQDCTIEWFHFECVGIMVPPKGKWYCPDCRKRRDLM